MLLILDEVIVGRDVTSLLKCYMDETPIVLSCHQQPTVDLKFENQVTIEQLQTKSHSEAWSMLKFLCGMRGLIVNPHDLEYVRIEGDTLKSKGVSVQFKKCHIFPDSVIKTDLKQSAILNQNLYRIVDFMRLKFCDASNLDPIFPKGSFISRIESTGKKEMYAVSYLTKEQLTNFDYSDTMVRFITQKLLVDREGVHRPLIHKGGHVRRIPKLEVTDRVVVPMEETVYSSTKKIKFYDRKKRINIIKTYSRNHPSIEG